MLKKSTATFFALACHAKVVSVNASQNCFVTLRRCALSRPLSCSTVCQEGGSTPLPQALQILQDANETPLLFAPLTDASNQPLVPAPRQLQAIVANATTLQEPTLNGTAVLEVEEKLLNKGDQPPDLHLIGTLQVSRNVTEPLYGIPNASSSLPANGQVGQCERVCVDDRIQGCVLQNTCHEPIEITEMWNVTHYCIANNGTHGGWGFRVPLSVAVKPASIESLVFESEIFPATLKEHIITGDKVNLTLGFSEDSAPRAQDTIVRKCAIEALPGVPITADVLTTDHEDGSKVLRLRVQDPPVVGDDSSKVIVGDNLLITMVGMSQELANGGPVPPPFDNTIVTLTHVMNF